MFSQIIRIYIKYHIYCLLIVHIKDW